MHPCTLKNVLNRNVTIIVCLLKTALYLTSKTWRNSLNLNPCQNWQITLRRLQVHFRKPTDSETNYTIQRKLHMICAQEAHNQRTCDASVDSKVNVLVKPDLYPLLVLEISKDQINWLHHNFLNLGLRHDGPEFMFYEGKNVKYKNGNNI